MGQLAKKQDTLPVETPPVVHMLQSAIDKGVDADALTKLVDLHERVVATEARKAFNQAMLEFQSECASIVKNSMADIRSRTGASYSYKYATLDHIADKIRPLLRECGLSYTFDSGIDDGVVKATCHVNHIEGHSESASFQAPIDTEANMNDAQKVASALSYARRYALIQALGITTGDRDDDGHSMDVELITDHQAANIDALIEEVGADRTAFLKWLKVDAVSEINAAGFIDAVKALERKRKQK